MSTHQVTRFEVSIAAGYDEARRRFEAAVPVLDQVRLGEFVKRKARWDEVVADALAVSPLGFFIFWSLDVSSSMALNGNTTKCCEYLMGNHTIAERMFRIDPTAMLYVPLRIVIFEVLGASTTFVMERPSSILSSLGSEQITAVGAELDRKVVRLLEYLGLNVPIELVSD